jgi:lipid A ethanolaminephosphotransferase
MKKLTQTRLIFACALFFCAFYNFSFFKKTLLIYPFKTHVIFILSLTVFLTAAINLFLNIIRVRIVLKPMLAFLFIISSLAAYVMDQYGVVIDENMLVNIFHTDTKEALDLVNPSFFFYLIGLGIIPAILISKFKIEVATAKREISARFISMVLSLVLIVLAILPLGKSYASFFREQKSLRYYTNPTYYMFSTGRYISSFFGGEKKDIEKIGLKALVASSDVDRELIILVVGETARRDRFSLNGYKRKTNPLLEKENVISFENVTSCGTSTAVSVPCMFSHFSRSGYSDEKGATTENLLDLLTHTKRVEVLWRDNNSNSKGVALRVPYEDYKASPPNTLCDEECRDEGMLVGLQDYINSKKDGDLIIVLHQMGNHGPAYFKRYPKEFEKFTPVCKTSELSNCTNEEINNAYDNAILYTDYFLAKVIDLLKKNSDNFETGMLYISDHGESLGENGVYLHSMPYFMAPDEQKNVPLIMWFGGELAEEINYKGLKQRIHTPYSHDNLFHTMLGILEVQTDLYKKDHDILSDLIKH